MVARWYRPPEIILNNRKYDNRVDIWSIGCVIAEIIYMWNQDCEVDDRYLFKGTSCYPLSPVYKETSSKIVIEETDQMCKILQSVGPLL